VNRPSLTETVLRTSHAVFDASKVIGNPDEAGRARAEAAPAGLGKTEDDKMTRKQAEAETQSRSEGIRERDRVHLRGCPYGAPGVVVAFERKKAVIWWPGLELLGKHAPEALMLARERGDR
jgi:hypothetical protein